MPETLAGRIAFAVILAAEPASTRGLVAYSSTTTRASALTTGRGTGSGNGGGVPPYAGQRLL
jgi:hypothetical protein